MHPAPRAGLRSPRGRVTRMDEPPAARAAVGPPRAPRISVIVPTWNEAKYLPGLFESLKHQTIPPDEVLIADSGSSDDTPEVARRAGATVVEGERQGPGEGRNRGARAATGNVLVFVDADCILPPNLIESVFLALADPAVVGGATGFAPANGRRVERSLFYLANAYHRAQPARALPSRARTVTRSRPGCRGRLDSSAPEP